MPTDKQPRVERNSGRPADKSKRDLRNRPVSTVTWAEVDNQHIRDAVVAIADSGAAIMLARTSDGGAFSITVLDGDNRVREWPHTVEDCEKTLEWLVHMFESN